MKSCGPFSSSTLESQIAYGKQYLKQKDTQLNAATAQINKLEREKKFLQASRDSPGGGGDRSNKTLEAAFEKLRKEFRQSFAAAAFPAMSVELMEDERKPAGGQSEQKQPEKNWGGQVETFSGFEISKTKRYKPNGTVLCRAEKCDKIAQAVSYSSLIIRTCPYRLINNTL